MLRQGCAGRPRARGPIAVARTALVCSLVLLPISGCEVLSTPSLQIVPRAWRDCHPWGPAANEVRAQGFLPYRTCKPEMACWAEFARQHLEDGDIVLRRSKSCLIPHFDASKILAGVSDSAFSHSAIAHWEGDSVWVYDVENEGVRKQPFEVWALDIVGDVLAVLRPRPLYRDRIPYVLAFCHESYLRNIPFDFALAMGDQAFYCTEFVEKAFRSAGVPLSEAVPIRCLPNYPRYQTLAVLVEAFTSIRVDEPVYAIGNTSYGIYASPVLERVYQSAGACKPKLTRNKPPRCPGTGPSGRHLLPALDINLPEGEVQRQPGWMLRK